MSGVLVTLTPQEMWRAAEAGVARQIENIQLNRIPHHGAGDRNDWQLHIEGCMGELALSKFLGIEWHGKGKLRAPDVGEVDVRTAAEDHYRLILHNEDPDDRVFWLLCGKNGTYSVKGWLLGREGKQQRFWKDPKKGRPAYFVDQCELHSPNVTNNFIPLNATPNFPGYTT